MKDGKNIRRQICLVWTTSSADNEQVEGWWHTGIWLESVQSSINQKGNNNRDQVRNSILPPSLAAMDSAEAQNQMLFEKVAKNMVEGDFEIFREAAGLLTTWLSKRQAYYPTALIQVWFLKFQSR